MTVDGVPIPLGENCRTAENIEVVLDGRGYTSEMPPNPIHPEPELNTWHTSEFYTSINGGKMVGNTSMQEFGGCGAGAEDLSALISENGRAWGRERVSQYVERSEGAGSLK